MVAPSSSFPERSSCASAFPARFAPVVPTLAIALPMILARPWLQREVHTENAAAAAITAGAAAGTPAATSTNGPRCPKGTCNDRVGINP